MPATARKHFDDDIARAWAIHEQAGDDALGADLARASVAFAVGALDAYLCDAFVDSLARTLKTCRRNGTEVPNAYGRLTMPIGPLLNGYEHRENWGLRMSARAMMERDNLLQLGRLRELLNPALRPGQKLWHDLVPQYIALDRLRLTGIRRSAYARLPPHDRGRVRRSAANSVLRRIGEIVQRRHDIVHNCDRPKLAKQRLSLSAAKKMLTDIESFVTILDDHLDQHRLF